LIVHSVGKYEVGKSKPKELYIDGYYSAEIGRIDKEAFDANFAFSVAELFF
jgi:hypothetical protein